MDKKIKIFTDADLENLPPRQVVIKDLIYGSVFGFIDTVACYATTPFWIYFLAMLSGNKNRTFFGKEVCPRQTIYYNQREKIIYDNERIKNFYPFCCDNRFIDLYTEYAPNYNDVIIRESQLYTYSWKEFEFKDKYKTEYGKVLMEDFYKTLEKEIPKNSNVVISHPDVLMYSGASLNHAKIVSNVLSYFSSKNNVTFIINGHCCNVRKKRMFGSSEWTYTSDFILFYTDKPSERKVKLNVIKERDAECGYTIKEDKVLSEFLYEYYKIL